VKRGDLMDAYAPLADSPARRRARQLAHRVVGRLSQYVTAADSWSFRYALETTALVSGRLPFVVGEVGFDDDPDRELADLLEGGYDQLVWVPRELPDLLGAPNLSPLTATMVVQAWMTSSSTFATSVRSLKPDLGDLGLVEWLQYEELLGGGMDDAVFAELLLPLLLPDRAPYSVEVIVIPKQDAYEFVKQHHSKLGGEAKIPPGVMFPIAAVQRLPDGQDQVVAVALAGTPTGRWARSLTGRPAPCGIHGILDLHRVASAGPLQVMTKNGLRPVSASSMLTARVMDLLPESGRHGHVGCLFVTYSLAGERGTSYLSLASKGLRPVAKLRGKRKSGARKGGEGTALPEASKVRWEYGPAALPPDWSALGIEAEKLRGPIAEFDAYTRRNSIRRGQLALRLKS